MIATALTDLRPAGSPTFGRVMPVEARPLADRRAVGAGNGESDEERSGLLPVSFPPLATRRDRAKPDRSMNGSRDERIQNPRWEFDEGLYMDSAILHLRR